MIVFCWFIDNILNYFLNINNREQNDKVLKQFQIQKGLRIQSYHTMEHFKDFSSVLTSNLRLNFEMYLKDEENTTQLTCNYFHPFCGTRFGVKLANKRKEDEIVHFSAED